MLQTEAKSQYNAALPRLDASNDRLAQSARLKCGILQEAQVIALTIWSKTKPGQP
jgi:hypothetical protein